jgi:translocation and assembly module TamB
MVGACVAVSAVLVVSAAVVVLHSLDRPWVKSRIQGVARASGGVEIDYRDVRVDGLSGADIEDLVVRSPDEVRQFAPELLRVGHVAVRWHLRSLLFGGGPALASVSISDATLTVVADEHGRTSFDALPPSPPSPPVPTSHLASKFLSGAPPIGRLDVGPVTLSLVQTDHGRVAARNALRGLALELTTASAEPAARGWSVAAHLGAPASPLDLELTRTPEDGEARAAHAHLWLTLAANASTVAAALDFRTLQQTFAPDVPAEHHLHAEANLRFEPAAGRTEVRIDHTDADDGAVTADASVDVFDAGDPIVRTASGDVDLARLLQWLPPGLVPVTAKRAHARYQVHGFAAGPVVHLAAGGGVDLNIDLADVDAHLASGVVRVGEGALLLHAEPADGGGIAGRGSAKLAIAHVPSGPDTLDMEDLAVDADGRQGADGVVTGRVGARFARLEQGGASHVVARDGRVDLKVEGLRPDADHPLATRGDLSLSSAFASVEARSPGQTVDAGELTVTAHARLEGHPPYAAELEVKAARFRLSGGAGKVLVESPLRFAADVHDVVPVIEHPAASIGVARVAMDLGPLRVSLDATKAADALDFAWQAKAASLTILRPFLPQAVVDRAPWDRMGLAVRSTGHVERIAGADPALRQSTQVDVEGPASFGDVAAQSLSVSLRSQGTMLRHQADLDLHAKGLAIEGGAAIDDHLTLHASVDRARPSLEFQLASDGRATSKVDASFSFDRARKAVLYDIDGRLADLGRMAPLLTKARHLDAFDLSELEVSLSAHGVVMGVVDAVGGDGTFVVDPDPVRTIAIEGKTDVHVGHFRWSHGDTAVATPSLAWHGDMRVDGARRILDSRFEVGSVHLDVGTRQVDFGGIDDSATAVVTGSLADPDVELEQRLAVRTVEQAIVPAYPIGDIAFALSAQRTSEGVVHISELKVVNGLGGTELTLSGNVDIGATRRSLSVTTSFAQDLARLSAVPERFSGRGKVGAEATVTSPDFVHYHVRATVKGEDVNIALARAGLVVEAANGEVPVTVTLEVGPDGVALERSERRSPYSMLRFTDQHPLLARSGFLSVASIKTPFISIAPLAGNLEVDQNLISLRQFEMGVRGGNITGQCAVDWDGPKSTVELHVRASGVQSSHGEPFDGNIAVAISVGDRTIDGRAEILRIGERHLLDLFDLQDPLHVDPAINRIRSALRFGYPDKLRLVFDHGFASAHLELGGLARLISIGELRGIPMGPIFDKMMGPMLEGHDTKEKPDPKDEP